LPQKNYALFVFSFLKTVSVCQRTASSYVFNLFPQWFCCPDAAGNGLKKSFQLGHVFDKSLLHLQYFIGRGFQRHLSRRIALWSCDRFWHFALLL